MWELKGVITGADPTSLDSIWYAGRGSRGFWDERARRWITQDSLFLFEAAYAGHVIEYQVHPEYGSVDSARAQVDTYAATLGRLPRSLLTAGREVELSRGRPNSGAAAGPCGGIFHIYSSQGPNYLASGYMEEVLVHEAGHLLTSQCQEHERSEEWLAAQKADSLFITPYARDNPLREDTAEVMWAWFVSRCVPERVNPWYVWAVETFIPARLAYFDELGLDCGPFG